MFRLRDFVENSSTSWTSEDWLISKICVTEYELGYSVREYKLYFIHNH